MSERLQTTAALNREITFLQRRMARQEAREMAAEEYRQIVLSAARRRDLRTPIQLTAATARAQLLIIGVKAVHEIVEAIGILHSVHLTRILGPSRKRKIVLARHEAWYEVRRQLGLSYPQLGRLFARDHATVICGIRRHIQRTAP